MMLMDLTASIYLCNPLPLRVQTEADLEAAAWGLLAWGDPVAEDGPSSPFWSEALMVEAVPAGEAPALSALAKAPECRLSGLRLRDGSVVLKVEQGERALQMRIADGEAFDPAGGMELRLPVGLDLKVRLRRLADLWPIGSLATKSGAAQRA